MNRIISTLVLLATILSPCHSLAGDKSLKFGIPKQFQGHWGSGTPEVCKLGSESASWFTVTSSKIIFNEDFCELKKIIASDRYKFSGYFYCAGEGEESTEQVTLKLDNGKLIQINKFISGASLSFRCK